MPGSTTNQNIPYPLANDPVNVHEDIQNIAESVDLLLTELQVPNLPLNVKNNNAFTLTKGTPVYINGYDVFPTVGKSISSDIQTFPVIGLIKSNITNGSSGEVIIVGLLENIDTSLFSSGDYLYVGESGGLVNTRPSNGSSVIAIVGKSSLTEGSIIVGPIKGGNATWGAIKNGI
jgi:hypothetical protein